MLVGSGVIDGADCCMCCMRYWLVAAQATRYHGDCRKRPRAQAENHAARLRACRHLQRGVQEHARLAWEDKHGRKLQERIHCGDSGAFGESFEACPFTTTLDYLRKTRPLDPRG